MLFGPYLHLFVIIECVSLQTIMAETSCDLMQPPPPPKFPDLEQIFRETLKETKPIEGTNIAIRELHEELKLNGSTPDNGEQDCDCGYRKYMENMADFNQNRCDNKTKIEVYCPVITTQAVVTTTVAKITVPVLVKSTKFPSKPTPASSSPKIPDRPVPTRTVSQGILPTSLRPSDQPSTTGIPHGSATQHKQDGVDVVLISVLGGVIAFLIIVMAFFICR